MATVTITITDGEREDKAQIAVNFDPPIDTTADVNSPAQAAAVFMLESISEHTKLSEEQPHD